jgi:hypothetical protein
LERLRNLEGKKKDAEADLQAVSSGSKTMTTIFKTSSDTNDMANKVE